MMEAACGVRGERQRMMGNTCGVRGRKVMEKRTAADEVTETFRPGNRSRSILVRLLAVLLLTLSVVPYNAVEVNAASSRWSQLRSKYRNKKSTNRLIFVQYTGGSNCKVYMYKKVKNKKGKYRWEMILRCKGYVGRNGIWKTREGDVKTPVGTFKVTEAFGVYGNPGTSVKYTKLTSSLYWSGEAGTYNTMVDSNVLGHIPANSEHLIDYQPHYNYALNIGYNKKNVFGKGSAIFLHCFGSNPYTGGCVAVSESNMKLIIQNLTKKTRVCIYPK